MRSQPGRHYRYYDLVMAAFVTVLLCSNLIGPAKVCLLPFPLPIVPKIEGGHLLFVSAVTFGAGNIFFPISYIFGDVLTEVYGYARSRKVIWAGFGALIFAAIHSEIVMRMPPDPNESFNKVLQPALEVCFGGGWRIVIASITAFWVGDFINSYVLAKMKLLTKGRFLWTRTIGSTICGQGADSLIFYPLAFGSPAYLFGLLGLTAPKFLTDNTWMGTSLFAVVIFNWVFKVTVEVIATPLTYLIVGFLKRAEQEDYFDYDTNFTPFSLKD
jgi:uncharacterized integral membrane protein (TIGR00697 family)